MDRTPYVGQYGDPEPDISAGARKYIDQIEGSLKATGHLGLSGYDFAVTRNIFELESQTDYNALSGISLNPVEAEALMHLLEGWLQWRRDMG